MFCIVVRDVEDKKSTPRPASQDEDVINKINSTKRDFGPFMNADRTNAHCAAPFQAFT